MNPFTQPGTQAPVTGFAPMNPFDGIENAKMPGSGRPRLAENFSYVVEVTDYKIYKTNIITEYTVTQSSGGSPVGSISSCVRSQKADGWEGYFAKFVYANMGVDPSNPAEVAQAKPFFSRCLNEALTKVADASLPLHLIGRKMRLDVRPGKPPAPGGKYYPDEWYSACND